MAPTSAFGYTTPTRATFMMSMITPHHERLLIHPRLQLRLALHHHVKVAICYETKGLITFYAQISPTRAAWQHIPWPTHFYENWDTTRIAPSEILLWR